MKKFLQKKLKNEKGMTLIELLAVIVIIAIIAAIAIPAIGGIIENSRVGAIKSDAQNVLSAGELYFLDNTATSVTLDKLVADGFVEDVGSFAAPTGVTVFKKGTGTTPTTATTISGTGTASGGVTVVFTGADRDAIETTPNSAGNTGAAVGAKANTGGLGTVVISGR